MVRKSILIKAGMIVAMALATVSAAEGDMSKAQNLQSETAKAEAQLCQNLKSLEIAMAPIDTVKATTKVQELRNVRTNADKEIKEVKKSLSGLEKARMKELETAFENFKKAVQKIPGNETVGNAAPTLTEEAQAVRTAKDRYNAPLNCQMGGYVPKEKKQ